MIYDISPPISLGLAVWPGDTPPTREVLLEIGRPVPKACGIVSNITLSTLHATVHLGAHADAPSHYGAGAPAIDERALDYYVGRCQVIRVRVSRGGLVTPKLLPPISAERVLIATGTYPDPEQFNEDFAALAVEAVESLSRQGVKLVGVDTPSVDPFSSKELPAHQACLRHDMAILEGLVLKNVPEGVYELIALPLRLVGFDASPVRAILRG
jgi:arylformamidase